MLLFGQCIKRILYGRIKTQNTMSVFIGKFAITISPLNDPLGYGMSYFSFFFYLYKRQIRIDNRFAYQWGCSKTILTHLCFADDLVLLCHADLISACIPFLRFSFCTKTETEPDFLVFEKSKTELSGF